MTLQRIEVKDSKQAIQEALSHEEFAPLILTKKGKPVAALLPLEDGDYESIALSLNPDFMAIIERSRRSAREKGTIPLDEVKRRLGIPGE